MICFPAFIDLEEKSVLICGGGHHALEKVRRLRPFRPAVTVIAPDFCEELREEPGIRLETRRFEEADARSLPVMVVAAEDFAENRRIAALCRKYRVPVNAVDQQEDCDFIFPALIAREPLCIGISSAGVSPSAAVEVKRQVEELLPRQTSEILLWLGELRPAVFARTPDSGLRRRLLRRLVQEAFVLDRPLTGEEAEQLIREEEAAAGQPPKTF